MNSDTLIAHWLLSRPGVVPTQGHWLACQASPESVRSVVFDAEDGGGCSTCAFGYETVGFTFSCACQKRVTRKDSIDISHLSLSDIFNELDLLSNGLGGVLEDAYDSFTRGMSEAEEAKERVNQQIDEDRESDRYED